MYGHSNTNNKHVMGMFSHGTETAAKFKDLDDGAIVHALLSGLDRIYDGKAREEYTGNSLVQQWTNEEYVKTGYTQFAPYSALSTMRKPLAGGTVWFAGEAIPPDAEDWGFAHGAAQSGKRAARKVESKHCSRFPQWC